MSRKQNQDRSLSGGVAAMLGLLALAAPVFAQPAYRVKDINATPSHLGSNPFPLVKSGAFLYFTGTDDANGTELWKTDGTAAGTGILISGVFLRTLRGLGMPEATSLGTPPLPSLLALAAAGAAGTALLRRRRSGLDRPKPGEPVAQADVVLRLGVLSILVFGLREILDRAGQAEPVRYVRLLGSGIEVAAFYFFWVSVSEARRRAGSLWDEPYLWLGLALALTPGGIDWLASLIGLRR